jgi:hypothetical protein
MAAGLSLSRATITPDAGEPWVKVSIVVRQNVGRIRRGHELLATADVAAVEPVSRGKEWRVMLTDGQTWNVKKERGGCGCGGG